MRHDERDSAPRTAARRAVLDGARRKVERALMAAEAADELANAAEAVLTAAGDQPAPAAGDAFEALRTALARYRKAQAP